MCQLGVRTIFKDLQKEDLESAPRDYKAIHYLKQKEKKKKKKKKTSGTPSGNLADEMLDVFNLRFHPFVQQVNFLIQKEEITEQRKTNC